MGTKRLCLDIDIYIYDYNKLVQTWGFNGFIVFVMCHLRNQ